MPVTPARSSRLRQLCAALALALTATGASAQTEGLRIVVIEGEAGVNIVQQRSAVAPVVEVRDRNNQPIVGAVVRFAIQNGRATFGGARTLTVTTNAAGRAVATGLTPTGSGALQIGTSAAFQGQTAVATIAQTNVMTAAQAAQIGAASTASGSGTGGGTAAGGAGAGGSGGGLSAATVAIIGGAAAGGAIAANEVFNQPEIVQYRGPVQIQVNQPVQRTVGGTTSLVCSYTLAIAGSAMIEIIGGNEVGDFYLNYTTTQVSTSCSTTFSSPEQRISAEAGGTPENIQFSKSFNNVNGSVTSTSATTFTGSLSGTVVNGTVTISWTDTEQIGGGTNTAVLPPTAIAVTLQRQ